MPKEASQASGSHSLNEDDLEKMVSDAVFYCLIADQKKAVIKVRLIIVESKVIQLIFSSILER